MASSYGVLSADNLLIEDGIFFSEKKQQNTSTDIYILQAQSYQNGVQMLPTDINLHKVANVRR